MATRNQNLQEEAQAGLVSLIQQGGTVFLGFILMLLLTGGAPSGFAIALSFGLGTTFVAWSEQKRIKALQEANTVERWLNDKSIIINGIQRSPSSRTNSMLQIYGRRAKHRLPRRLSPLSRTNTFIRAEPTIPEAVAEIKQIFTQLDKTYPNATESEKIFYINDQTTPSFKRLAVIALQASSDAVIEELLDSHNVNIAKVLIKDWLNSK